MVSWMVLTFNWNWLFRERASSHEMSRKVYMKSPLSAKMIFVAPILLPSKVFLYTHLCWNRHILIWICEINSGYLHFTKKVPLAWWWVKDEYHEIKCELHCIFPKFLRMEKHMGNFLVSDSVDQVETQSKLCLYLY